jgi:talin
MKKEGSILEQLDNLNVGLVLRKKYFVNDANVDRDDPVQLHLVYIQSRDDILQGRHPTQKDEAIQLASLQCQIDGGTVILTNPQLK